MSANITRTEALRLTLINYHYIYIFILAIMEKCASCNCKQTVRMKKDVPMCQFQVNCQLRHFNFHREYIYSEHP